jgi:pimeloyl-ACP methyl ester carboxylesterase
LPKENVVLLHGLARMPSSMSSMGKFLARRGFKVHNVGYPSTRNDIASLARDLAWGPLQSIEEPGQELHFVTHSMGGIVLRYIDQYFPLASMGKVVMLAPPNRGSEIVNHLRCRWWARWLLGPAFLELGTTERALPKAMGDVDFPLGVIAGERSGGLMFRGVVPRPSDGKVSLDSTKVGGMKDHKVVSTGHTWIMNNKEVQEATLHFLRQGWFLKSY